jgi:putative ABC transport system ATP-binding protein
MSPIVEARGISKILGTGAGQVEAVRSVDLTLNGGELTVLMGPSGSGKTTLLSILGCLLTPTQGTLRLCGTATSGATAEQLAEIRRRHVGFVFQSFHLFRTMTALENTQLALDVRGESGQQARSKAEAVLTRVGLGQRARKFPRQLSGGEQQRVAIARALVAEPALVLADEPTAALDTANGQAIMEILAGIAKERHRAVLVVTHDTRLASFADRIHFIEDGRLIGDERTAAPIHRLRSRA